MSFELALAAITVLGGSILLHKKKGFLITFILLWWFFWLNVSSLSVAGVIVPSERTYGIYVFFLVSLFVGSIIYKFYFDRYHLVLPVSSMSRQEHDQRLYAFCAKVLLYVVAPFVIYYLLKALWLMIHLDSMAGYRAIAFGLNGEPSPIFHDIKIVMHVYNHIVTAALFAIFFVGVTAYINYGKYKLLLLSSVLLIADALITMGRVNMYVVLLFISIAFFIKNGLSFKSLIRYAPVFLLPFSIIYFVTEKRMPDVGVKQIVDLFVVNYHTFGFAIFNASLNDTHSVLNHYRLWGEASIGSIDFIVKRAIQLFDPSAQIGMSMVGDYLSTNMQLGVDQMGNPIFANAFGTILFPLYLDGGVSFVIIGGLLFGFFITRSSYLFFSTNSLNQLVGLLLFYMLYFGTMSPVLSGNWLVTLLFIVFSYWYTARSVSRVVL